MPDNVSQTRVQTICLVILVAVAITFVVYWLRPVLVPFVVAVFVVSGISPVLDLLEKRLGVSRIVAAGLTFLSGVVILVIFGISIWLSVLDLSKNSGAYRARVRELVMEIEDKVPLRLSSSSTSETSAPERSINRTDEKISHFIDALVGNAISVVSQTFISLVSTSVVVLIFVFFLLIGSPAIDGGNQTLQDINEQVEAFLESFEVVS